MFQGFDDTTVDFLWGIRLNNERPWFEAHKQDYLDHLYRPMKELGDELYDHVARIKKRKEDEKNALKSAGDNFVAINQMRLTTQKRTIKQLVMQKNPNAVQPSLALVDFLVQRFPTLLDDIEIPQLFDLWFAFLCYNFQTPDVIEAVLRLFYQQNMINIARFRKLFEVVEANAQCPLPQLTEILETEFNFYT